MKTKYQCLPEKQPHYGLRKLSIGLASVLLGVAVLSGPNSAKANSLTNSQQLIEPAEQTQLAPNNPTTGQQAVLRRDSTATMQKEDGMNVPKTTGTVTDAQIKANANIISNDQSSQTARIQASFQAIPVNTTVGRLPEAKSFVAAPANFAGSWTASWDHQPDVNKVGMAEGMVKVAVSGLGDGGNEALTFTKKARLHVYVKDTDYALTYVGSGDHSIATPSLAPTDKAAHIYLSYVLLENDGHGHSTARVLQNQILTGAVGATLNENWPSFEISNILKAQGCQLTESGEEALANLQQFTATPQYVTIEVAPITQNEMGETVAPAIPWLRTIMPSGLNINPTIGLAPAALVGNASLLPDGTVYSWVQPPVFESADGALRLTAHSHPVIKVILPSGSTYLLKDTDEVDQLNTDGATVLRPATTGRESNMRRLLTFYTYPGQVMVKGTVTTIHDQIPAPSSVLQDQPVQTDGQPAEGDIVTTIHYVDITKKARQLAQSAQSAGGDPTGALLDHHWQPSDGQLLTGHQTVEFGPAGTYFNRQPWDGSSLGYTKVGADEAVNQQKLAAGMAKDLYVYLNKTVYWKVLPDVTHPGYTFGLLSNNGAVNSYVPVQVDPITQPFMQGITYVNQTTHKVVQRVPNAISGQLTEGQGTVTKATAEKVIHHNLPTDYNYAGDDFASQHGEIEQIVNPNPQEGVMFKSSQPSLKTTARLAQTDPSFVDIIAYLTPVIHDASTTIHYIDVTNSKKASGWTPTDGTEVGYAISEKGPLNSKFPVTLWDFHADYSLAGQDPDVTAGILYQGMPANLYVYLKQKVQPTTPDDPVNPTQLTENSQPSEPTPAPQPTGLPQPSQPIPAPQPTLPVQPTAAVQPTVPAQPTSPVQPTENSQPIPTAKPTEPQSPTTPATVPVHPDENYLPAKPGRPKEDSQPATAAEMLEPKKPEVLVSAEQPVISQLNSHQRALYMMKLPQTGNSQSWLTLLGMTLATVNLMLGRSFKKYR